MNFLHWDGVVGPDKVIVVAIDHAANVQLMDDINFNAYQSGRSFRYAGGNYRASPVILRPPHHGHWHIVVDLGGRSGSIRAGITVRTAA